MDISRLKEKLTDAEIAKKISEITDAKELQTALAEIEIEISMEEAEQVTDLLAKIHSGEVTKEQLVSVQQQLENGDELDEEALASVSGGVPFLPAILIAIVVCSIVGGGSYGLSKL